jgi:multiple sugar transport system substrate-binding protein
MKRISWLVLAVALMLVASACSSSSTDTTVASAGGGTETTAAGGGGSDLSGTVRVWTHQNDAFNSGLQALADGFMADSPGVTIEFETFDYDTYIQTLQTALPAGTEADILQMFGDWTCSYSTNLATVPSDVMSVDTARADFFEAPIEGYICDETLYGFPQEYNIEYGATLFNSAIAEEVGATGDWATWDDFIAEAQKMTELVDGNMLRAGYNFTASDAIPATFYSNILQAGGSYLGDDGFTIDTPEARTALELMVSFVEAGLVDPVLYNDESNWVGDSYFEETSAQGLVGPWVVPEYSADFPDVAAVTEYKLLPILDGGTQALVADSGWGLTVSKGSEVQDAAWAFVQYVATVPENAAAWNSGSGTLPALVANGSGATKDSLVAEFPHFEQWFQLLESGQYVGDMPDRDLVWYDITYPHILNVLQGNESIDDALAAMEKEANETFG